jgi:phosphatidate phosphatase APP1
MIQLVCIDYLIGSLKLRSYAGRSLFSGLMSAPAARKRAGLVETMDSFTDSFFILIGDSGEQDLELYAQYVDLTLSLV